MITVAVVAIMTAAITRIVVRKPNDEWNTVVERVNIMLAQAAQQALLTQKNHRLTFMQKEKGGVALSIEIESKNLEKPTQFNYDKVTSLRIENPFELPSTFFIHEVLINGINQFGNRAKSASIFITKEGIVQPAIIHIARARENETSKKSLVIQPFLGTCELQAGFVKP